MSAEAGRAVALEAAGPLPEAELQALLDLWVESWAAAMPAIDFAARRAWFAGHLEALRRDGAVLVRAREAATLAGFLTVHPGTGALDQLAVGRAFQRRGVARLLVAEAKRRAPAGLHLSVNTANAAAVALYRREGFRRTGETTNPRSGLPVWTMAWEPGASA